MVLSRVLLIRVKLVLVNLNPINDTYIHMLTIFSEQQFPETMKLALLEKFRSVGMKEAMPGEGKHEKVSLKISRKPHSIYQA